MVVVIILVVVEVIAVFVFLIVFVIVLAVVVQWKLLNVITLGQIESDNINQMITLSELLLMQST